MEGNGCRSSSSDNFGRIVSKAAQIGGSAHCKSWTTGLLCGVCIMYLSGVALPQFRGTQSRSVYPPLWRTSFWNTSSADHGMIIGMHLDQFEDLYLSSNSGPDLCFALGKDELITAVHEKIERLYGNDSVVEARITSLYNAWSTLLNATGDDVLKSSNVLRPPHMENCRLNVEKSMKFDSYGENGTFPPWALWKGSLGLELLNQTFYAEKIISYANPDGQYPPWIVGSDRVNYPLTRRVQRDIWIHQHPRDCSDPSLRFLVADWERLPGFGIGAQIAGMVGLLAIAMNCGCRKITTNTVAAAENTVAAAEEITANTVAAAKQRLQSSETNTLTRYYNRADHDGCKGVTVSLVLHEKSVRSSWSCYFFPETTPDCQKKALELMRRNDSLATGVVKVKENYTSKKIWAGQIPRYQCNVMDLRYLNPGQRHEMLLVQGSDVGRTLEIYATNYGDKWQFDHASSPNGEEMVDCAVLNSTCMQATRYLMRFPTEYMCGLLNVARHSAFAMQAAKRVLESTQNDSPKAGLPADSDIERLVWSDHKPYLPRPLLSMHEVIDKTELYPDWNFYFTRVKRQSSRGNMSMAAYEASLGRETSTNNPLVNFMMATEADFFVGALGSTWCYLIDGMRNTGGKVMSGYLSVNKDRSWVSSLTWNPYTRGRSTLDRNGDAT
ncbi:hypothetical protein EJB05_54329, partial [Eragrostis curvula]